MRRVFISEPLEVAGGMFLVGASVTVGWLFHRTALGVLLGLLVSAALLIYFAHVYQDVQVKVRMPALPRRKAAPTPEPTPGQVVRVCGVCNLGPGVSHKKCNQVVARTAATMRRPRDP